MSADELLKIKSSSAIREIADYDIDEEIIGPIASLTLDDGKAFLTEIKRFLETKLTKDDSNILLS